LSHDVESSFGVSHCEQLADIDEERGFRSTFGFVPLRYHTPERLRHALVDRGFDINVQGLYHDGRDFRNRRLFEKRRGPMQDFLRSWHSRGFTGPSSLHNLPWFGELDIDFDLSVFDVDPFEPQPCHFGRIFPFWVQPPAGVGSGFVEIPNTLVQDFTLFVLMRERSNAVWLTKLDWIAEHGGLAVLKTHPDYMAFSERDERMDRYPVRFYSEFLDYVRRRYDGEVWLARPSEVARYWRSLSSEAVHPLELMDGYCNLCLEAHRNGLLRQYPTHVDLDCVHDTRHSEMLPIDAFRSVEAANRRGLRFNC
jgi:hypothetical protein